MTDKPKPRLLIDMDGVIVDLMGAAYKAGLFTKHYPCKWTFEGCCTTRTQTEIFNHTDLFEMAQPIGHAIDSVKQLDRHFDVRIVSAPWHTNWQSAGAKFDWIAQNFGPGWTSRVILTTDKTAIDGVALVDDKPGLQGPWQTITYPQPWNGSHLPTWRAGLAGQLIDIYTKEQ